MTVLHYTHCQKIKLAVSLLAVGDEPLSEGFVIVPSSAASDEQQVNVMCFSHCTFVLLKKYLVNQCSYNTHTSHTLLSSHKSSWSDAIHEVEVMN